MASGPGGVRLVERPNDHASPHPYVEPNTVQKQMQFAFIGKQNQFIEQVTASGREDLVAGLIKVNCYAMLTVMRPDEQQHEMHDVWQVDVWVPRDPQWAAVCKAPSMVNSLLKVSPEVCAKIQAEADRLSDLAMAPFRAMMNRLEADPAYRALSKEEQIERMRAENRKLYAGRSKADLAAENGTRCDRMLNFIRPLLNRAQQSEFDTIRAQFDSGVASVMKGQTPSYLESK